MNRMSDRQIIQNFFLTYLQVLEKICFPSKTREQEVHKNSEIYQENYLFFYTDKNPSNVNFVQVISRHGTRLKHEYYLTSVK
ncbi:hypothetical protein BpHYR1_040011 [Brachionus plicatilis]|uniref:Uncharacterized protein n=1 Tax=Brachionus plicatilis TaxID=10195 RepID=A0A3M7QZ91_BRAPC|nr:hypothetical protein BpHYR1_040011 [Brachionus plicatilis]